MSGTSARVDAFTDAAFAFAVTLLVIGGAGAPTDLTGLLDAVADIPAFAIGFAIIVMFWFTHVRWRALRGEGDWRSTMLTLLLVFLALIYIQPLRAMAAAMAEFFTGQGAGFGGDLGGLFAVYGTGFAAMALVTAGLFAEALHRPGLSAGDRAVAKGDLIIWLILAATGGASTLLAAIGMGHIAPLAYATLPITIGVFASRWKWSVTEDGSPNQSSQGSAHN